MTRRLIGLLVTLTLGLLAVSLAADGPLPMKAPRVGVLSPQHSTQSPTVQREPFAQGLRAVGWEPGTSLLIEHRYAEGEVDRLPALAAELVRLPVDVLVTRGPQATRAAQQATGTIPIVMSATPDPVQLGFVASLAWPGVNITGLAFLAQGNLVLLPLDLAPSQWEPLLPTLSAEYSTITRGGAAVGPVMFLKARGRSRYLDVVQRVLRAVRRQPGEATLEVWCGSGVVVRELARQTAGANRLIGLDINPYLLREARGLARQEGLGDAITFREGDAAALPFPADSVDVTLACTVLEEGDADRMLAALVRVTRPGGRLGAVVRATDMPAWVNLPLRADLKAQVEAPGLIGAGASAQGCADASLYGRVQAAGLTPPILFPELDAVTPAEPRLARFQQ